MSCLKRLDYSFIAIIVLTLKTREIFAFFLIPLVYLTWIWPCQWRMTVIVDNNIDLLPILHFPSWRVSFDLPTIDGFVSILYFQVGPVSTGSIRVEIKSFRSSSMKNAASHCRNELSISMQRKNKKKEGNFGFLLWWISFCSSDQTDTNLPPLSKQRRHILRFCSTCVFNLKVTKKIFNWTCVSLCGKYENEINWLHGGVQAYRMLKVSVVSFLLCNDDRVYDFRRGWLVFKLWSSKIVRATSILI